MTVDTSLASLTAFEPKNINTKADDKRLKEQTDNFEAFMIKKVLDISIKLENPLFGKDAGDKIYNSMYNDTFSKAMSGGLGYSELLYNFLKEQSN
jgi:Rod binding domain-containing protein